MSDTIEAAPPSRLDERVGRKSPLARLFARPEAGALAGAIVIYVFFFAELKPCMSEMLGLATWLVMVWVRARLMP